MYLFAGSTYYPVGGANDYIGMVSSREEALELLGDDYDWWHLTDGNMNIVDSGTLG